jgi:hypothetical protein
MQNDREEPKISELDEGFLSSVEDDRSVSGKSPRTLIAAISALLLVVAVVWFAFRPAVEAPVPSAASPSSPVKAAEPVLAPALDIPVPEPAPEPEQALVSEGEEVPPAEPAVQRTGFPVRCAPARYCPDRWPEQGAHLEQDPVAAATSG